MWSLLPFWLFFYCNTCIAFWIEMFCWFIHIIKCFYSKIYFYSCFEMECYSKMVESVYINLPWSVWNVLRALMFSNLMCVLLLYMKAEISKKHCGCIRSTFMVFLRHVTIYSWWIAACGRRSYAGKKPICKQCMRKCL